MFTFSHPTIKRILLWALVITFFLFPITSLLAAQVTLAWDPNTQTPDGYRVYARVEGQSYNYASPAWPNQGVSTTQTSCTLDNLADGTSYFFVVRAFVGTTESGNSNEVNYITSPADPVFHTISAAAGAHGTVAPQSATVASGSSQTINISADAGYKIAAVQVDGHSVGAVSSYTFSAVSGDHTLSASFAADTHTITVSSGTNGNISPSTTTVSTGGSQTFIISAVANYHIADVQVDGHSVGPVSSYTFNAVEGDHTLSASFAVDTHAITVSAGANGSISPSSMTVSAGGSQAFTISADANYHIADVVVDGNSVGPVSTYTFSLIDADHSISASFAADAFDIQANANIGGSISPSGLISVLAGSSHTFAISADEGYEVDDLLVDGNSAGALESYTFNSVNANHTIEALFKPKNQLPMADAGPDQVVYEQTTVKLSGLNSKDLDDGIASFEWRQIKGTLVDINSSSEETTSFTAPNVGTDGEALEFELTVTDFSGAKASDRCIVNVTWVNEPPVAHTGADQSVDEGSSVVLDASNSIDPDDGIAAYKWRQIQGPEVVLSNPTSFSPSFTTPDVGPQGAVLIFELTVTDVGGLQDTDNCTVVVTWDNMEPVADAGPDMQVALGDIAVLDGSDSFDPDGQELTYRWRQTFGPPVTISDVTSARPQFEIPSNDDLEGLELSFELTVTDGAGLQGVDTCRVTIQAAAESNDTLAPTLAIDSPSTQWVITRNNRIEFTGSAIDDREVEKIVWQDSRGNSGIAEGTTQWRIASYELRSGFNKITITAFDRAGNNQSKSINVYLMSWWSRR